MRNIGRHACNSSKHFSGDPSLVPFVPEISPSSSKILCSMLALPITVSRLLFITCTLCKASFTAENSCKSGTHTSPIHKMAQARPSQMKNSQLQLNVGVLAQPCGENEASLLDSEPVEQVCLSPESCHGYSANSWCHPPLCSSKIFSADQLWGEQFNMWRHPESQPLKWQLQGKPIKGRREARGVK